MSTSRDKIDEIVRRADQVKPEERRRYSSIREMRTDIAQRSELRRLSGAARAIPDEPIGEPS